MIRKKQGFVTLCRMHATDGSVVRGFSQLKGVDGRIQKEGSCRPLCRVVGLHAEL
jgi:hypothetical protein